MPQLLLIAASGTAQRRLLEETAAALEKEGYTAAGKQEGGEWNSLLSDNMTGGLFDEKRGGIDKGHFARWAGRRLGPSRMAGGSTAPAARVRAGKLGF